MAGFELVKQILHPTSVYTNSSSNRIGKIDKHLRITARILKNLPQPKSSTKTTLKEAHIDT